MSPQSSFPTSLVRGSVRLKHAATPQLLKHYSLQISSSHVPHSMSP